jgi:hypothetical protein
MLPDERLMNPQKAQDNVIPAQAWVHDQLKALDSGLRRNDSNGGGQTFCETLKGCFLIYSR